MKERVRVGFILAWLITFCMITTVISSHFRGGIFMLRPNPGGTQGEVKL